MRPQRGWEGESHPAQYLGNAPVSYPLNLGLIPGSKTDRNPAVIRDNE